MKTIKTTPNYLPLNKFNFTDEQLIELYKIVFSLPHSDGFMVAEIKDLLFNENYWFITTTKDGWEDKLKQKIIEFGYELLTQNN